MTYDPDLCGPEGLPSHWTDDWIISRKAVNALGELLAIINRDGGHFQEEHGLVEAISNARRIVYDLKGCENLMADIRRIVNGENY